MRERVRGTEWVMNPFHITLKAFSPSQLVTSADISNAKWTHCAPAIFQATAKRITASYIFGPNMQPMRITKSHTHTHSPSINSDILCGALRALHWINNAQIHTETQADADGRFIFACSIAVCSTDCWFDEFIKFDGNILCLASGLI
jgi:hypothetical protein